ncbi:MAG: DUF2058 domain-containing protein [Thiotrichales bacterium]|nr:DUF2058 domain-containing protein [Thiotrichales bacterium]
MAGSLFDQLKKSGLVSEHKAKQIKKEKYQQSKQHKGQAQDVPNEAAQLAAEALRLKAEKDHQLNQVREQQRAEHDKQAQLKQLLQSQALSGISGEIAYHFADEGKVKTLYVNRQTQKGLSAGQIRIARFEETYVLLSEATADKVAQRNAKVLLPFETEAQSVSDADSDYYAKFAIPDDLVW